ncbi:hypothetical protein LEM8419_00798 [Neolewinella maritima]|uniref:T9SS type A sorting domain-containing protein n=1 Tax=Neolewinella maritima TaxID=1383882 RepID=A0ABN8F4V0_9BACT|nr:T9SS type A sorting domain-containing protein [Neolewinella maritima]CAH0999498.1 hypothetical protein LEM8419_00798 [Neolewinella maritima]
MKPLYLALLLFLCTGVRAQSDFQLFRSGVQYMYENPSYSSGSPLESQYYGVRVDSLGCQELYTTIGFGDAGLPSACVFQRPSPFGYHICQTADSTVMDFGTLGRLVVYHGAETNSRWDADGPDGTIFAEVLNATTGNPDTTLLLGLADELTAIGFFTEGDSFLGHPLIIGRQYGLAQGQRLFALRTDRDSLRLAGISDPARGVQLPPAGVYGLAAVGDTFQVQDIGGLADAPFGGDGPFSKRVSTVTVLAVDTSADDTYRYEMRGSIYDLGPAGIDTVALDTTFSYAFARLPELLATTQPGALVSDTGRLSTTRVVHRAFTGPLRLLQRQFSTGISFAETTTSDSLCGFDLAGLDEEPSAVYTPYIPFSLDAFGTLGGPRETRLLYYRSGDRRFGELTDLQDIIISTRETLRSFDFALYPNPVSEQLYLELPGAGRYDVRVYTVAGTQVRQQWVRGGSAEQVSMATLPAGAYVLLVLERGRAVGRRRVVVR